MKVQSANFLRSLVAAALLLGMSGGGILTFRPVLAQATLPLTVAPARQELTVNPGDQTAINFRFYNNSEAPVSGFLKVVDFIVKDKEGSPVLLEDPYEIPPRFSAASWITLPYDRLTIAAENKVTVQAKINIPQNASPGGHYSAVFLETTPQLPSESKKPQEAATGTGVRLTSLVYLRVAGPAVERALISRLFAPAFLEYGPINVESEIANRGDYHLRPRGILTLSNIFGGPVDQQVLKEQNIFPDASRSYTNTLGKKWMLGKYKIDLTASYGEKGQVLNRFIYVWVFPWKAATVILLALIILFLLARNVYQKVVVKEARLEEEVEKEREEIEKLKEQLKKKQE